ncbi:MAG: AAA family ATPase [Ruminococcaceae bacterium]|nr:AAA family ATPase [Oscillospiraceae bacterium]
MKYLESFKLPTEQDELNFVFDDLRLDMTCYNRNNAYPFHIFPHKGLSQMTFAPITIFYGGNGSGKSTLLNVIAEKLRLDRISPFNRTPFFDRYLADCDCHLTGGRHVPTGSRIVTSDDVFDFLLDVRMMNQGIDRQREALFSEWEALRKDGTYRMKSLQDFEELQKRNRAKHMTRSAYTHQRIPDNLSGRSNGESAYAYFKDKIRENALYLLDEPENSLSVRLQKDLAVYLEESVRFYDCQLVISTHSPFLLSLKGARIYDLDSVPVTTQKWTELENVRVWYDFFEEHKDEF